MCNNSEGACCKSEETAGCACGPKEAAVATCENCDHNATEQIEEAPKQ